MLNIGTKIFGDIKQETIFYKDINNNGILDKQDLILEKIENATKNIEYFDKVVKEIPQKIQSGSFSIENNYYVGTKKVSLAEYNSYLLYSNLIDFIFIFLLLFIIWFLLLPKKINKND